MMTSLLLMLLVFNVSTALIEPTSERWLMSPTLLRQLRKADDDRLVVLLESMRSNVFSKAVSKGCSLSATFSPVSSPANAWNSILMSRHQVLGMRPSLTANFLACTAIRNVLPSSLTTPSIVYELMLEQFSVMARSTFSSMVRRPSCQRALPPAAASDEEAATGSAFLAAVRFLGAMLRWHEAGAMQPRAGAG